MNPVACRREESTSLLPLTYSLPGEDLDVLAPAPASVMKTRPILAVNGKLFGA